MFLHHFMQRNPTLPETDPHSALVECKRIVEEQAQRQIDDMRSRLTAEAEVNRQLREEIATLKACHPLTPELAERIAEAVIEDCQQARRVGSTATSVRTWLPTAWNIKQIILRVRDGEEKGERDV